MLSFYLLTLFNLSTCIVLCINNSIVGSWLVVGPLFCFHIKFRYMASNETISLCSLIWNRVFDSQVPMGDSCSLEKNLIELRFFFFFFLKFLMELASWNSTLKDASSKWDYIMKYFRLKLYNEIVCENIINSKKGCKFIASLYMYIYIYIY